MYGILRVLQGILISEVRVYLLIFGLLTVASAALLLGRQEDYKRMFAYSTAENMGMIMIGLSAGAVGVIGAIVVLVAHAFGKSSAFFLTGNLLARYGSTHMHDIRGVARRMPRTGYTLFFASLAVTGAPPFGVFVGELLILSAVVRSFGIAIALVISVFIVIAFITVNRRTTAMVFSHSEGDQMERGRVGTLVPILTLSLSVLTVGLVPMLPRLLSGVLGI
jgi:hydrogenase-4 component F